MFFEIHTFYCLFIYWCSFLSLFCFIFSFISAFLPSSSELKLSIPVFYLILPIVSSSCYFCSFLLFLASCFSSIFFPLSLTKCKLLCAFDILQHMCFMYDIRHQCYLFIYQVVDCHIVIMWRFHSIRYEYEYMLFFLWEWISDFLGRAPEAPY